VPVPANKTSSFHVAGTRILQLASRLDGVRVLLVDHAPPVREVITVMLEQCGATVTPVGTADEDLEALARTPPDVLLSDIQMPGKGGYWLIGQERALPPQSGGATPVVAILALKE